MAEKEGTAKELITAWPWCQARKSLFRGELPEGKRDKSGTVAMPSSGV